MKAETMFISSIDDDHEDPSEIPGGRLAEPHDFPWYLLIPVLKKNFLSVLRQFPSHQLLTIYRFTRSALRYDTPLQIQNFSILKQPNITVSQTVVMFPNWLESLPEVVVGKPDDTNSFSKLLNIIYVLKGSRPLRISHEAMDIVRGG